MNLKCNHYSPVFKSFSPPFRFFLPAACYKLSLMNKASPKKSGNIQICVIGDVMLDVFAYGTVNRISPEAPVPVLDIETETFHPGGALNVCNNLIALGVNTGIISAYGDDFEGFRLEELCERAGIDNKGLIRDADRVTTCKTRFFDKDEALIRTDREQRVAVSPETEQKLESAMRRALPSADACILQDYNKGVLTPELIKATLSEAKKRNIPVFVDPKFENLEQYTGTFVIKPNLHEAEYILKRRIRGMEAAKNAAETLFSTLSPRHILLTMGADGMILKDAGRLLHIPARRIEKADITGAGDTVIATLAAYYCSGMDMEESAEKANLAAAEVCAHPGVSTVTVKTLHKDR